MCADPALLCMQERAELLGDEKLGKTRGEKSSPRKSPHMKRTKTTQATTQVGYRAACEEFGIVG